MTRLQRELQRLYRCPSAPDDAPVDPGMDAAADALRLIDASGRVRAMVLELVNPAEWRALARVWHGVQEDLALTAPAIAVSGQDGHQLWFSLVTPVPAPQAVAFLEGLRGRYLKDMPPQRVSLLPAADDTSARSPAVPASPWRHARPVPAAQAGVGRWSAFVAPDLAPMFNDEPWLDLPPNPEGQADLLSRLASMPATDFERALVLLQPPAPVATPLPAAPPATDSPTATAAELATNPHPGLIGPWTEPQGFLRAVMNNDSVPLQLRIEAAKALIPCCDHTGCR